LRFFDLDESRAAEIAITTTTTPPAKIKVVFLEEPSFEIKRRVATTRIQRSDDGINTFQPNCMNWS
jgi:hypothetical protein